MMLICHTLSQGTCVALTGKAKIYVTNSNKIFVAVQTEHGVVEGERVCLFGSGGFRTAAEAEELAEKSRVTIAPDLGADSVATLARGARSGNGIVTSHYRCYYPSITATTATTMYK